MDNQNIPTSAGDDPGIGHSAIPEEAGLDSGLPAWYCGKSILFLSALAAACIIFVLNSASISDALPFIMAFPFAQIGGGLRALSLPGGVSNIIAIVLYAVFCLLPMLAFLIIRKKSIVDVLLPLISIVMFVVMYYMINPGLARLAAHTGSFEQALLGGIVYSLLVAYSVIRVLRLFDSIGTSGLVRYIGITLHLLNILFVVAAFGMVFAQMLDAFAALRAGNTAPGQQLGVTYAFLAMHHIIRALPYMLNIWVVLAAQHMLGALNLDPYSAKALAAAKDVSRICAVTLTVSVLALTGFNLLQLMFASRLHVINSNINFPITSMLFVLGALLVTRYIAESKQLKDENDQFV